MSLRRDYAVSLPVQLAAVLRDAIDRGALRPGEHLSATRSLATRLGVARGVVVAAYEQLAAEGYLVAVRGRGTAVNPDLARVRSVAEGAPGHSALPGSDNSALPGSDYSALPVPSICAQSQIPSAVPGSCDCAQDDSGLAGSCDCPRDDSGLAGSEPDGAQLAGAGTPGAAAAWPRPPLAPGAPLTDATERPAWRAAWRAGATHSDHPAPPLGDSWLRSEIAEHLRRMRGTARPPHDVIVTAGAREGLSLLIAALRSARGNIADHGVAPAESAGPFCAHRGTRGPDLVVGVEDPGYPSLRGAAQRLGARIVSLSVDSDGLRTDRLPEGELDLVVVTPSHQYPAGGSLPLPRRHELLRWAARSGVIVVEDDYDSELRHVGSPLPALAALDDPLTGSVVTMGTFSSTITPALAAGFLLAPANLRALVEPVRQDLGSPVSAVAQHALATYLAGGELRRNIARMRRLHARRREAISARLAGLPGVRVRLMSGGLHAVIELTGADARDREAAVVARASEPTRTLPAGLGVAALGTYWQHHRIDRTAGLVLGMGGPDEREFHAALARLRAILTS